MCLLARSGLSVPASSVRTATTQIGSRNHAVSSLDIVPTLNLTSAVPDVGMKYLVPNTYVMEVKYLLGASEIKKADSSTFHQLSPQQSNTDSEISISQITMFFYLGFRIDEVAMKDTIDAAMK